MRIARCLRCTAKFGMHSELDTSRGVEAFVNAYFSGNWSKENSLDHNYVLSRTSHVTVLFDAIYFGTASHNRK